LFNIREAIIRTNQGNAASYTTSFPGPPSSSGKVRTWGSGSSPLQARSSIRLSNLISVPNIDINGTPRASAEPRLHHILTVARQSALAAHSFAETVYEEDAANETPESDERWRRLHSAACSQDNRFPPDVQSQEHV
jgi:hypothetical protein